MTLWCQHPKVVVHRMDGPLIMLWSCYLCMGLMPFSSCSGLSTLPSMLWSKCSVHSCVLYIKTSLAIYEENNEDISAFHRMATKTATKMLMLDGVTHSVKIQHFFLSPSHLAPHLCLIKDYREEHPEVTVLDPPDAIQHVYNRQSMLQDVADLNLSDFYGQVCVPRQLVITKDASSIPEAVMKAGLKLPLVAKPLSAKSHELSLAYDSFSLSKLDPPLVLQEFVNHGGVLFKVYIVGEAIKVVRRFSLPDVNKRDLLNIAGVFRFPRVSCAAASADDADLDPCVAELPPRPLLERLAKELRRRLGLRLFNIDIIREHGMQDRFYVIDINYFPGYSKMPGYEQIFTDFLLSLVQSKYKRRLSSS